MRYILVLVSSQTSYLEEAGISFQVIPKRQQLRDVGFLSSHSGQYVYNTLNAKATTDSQVSSHTCCIEIFWLLQSISIKWYNRQMLLFNITPL